jgi:hypothetical protein
MHPKIEEWLAARSEALRIRRLEGDAAEAWWNSLSLEQREVYAELQDAGHGLHHLQNQIIDARIKAHSRRGGRKD